ncbi:MAG: hypothetical protein IJ654_01995 [Bacteroidales bacterium]|nr:hypothetical protein [Bacteroidales bacterium]
MLILQEMKAQSFISRLFSAVPALLLAVWYLLAVSGLDVHCDNEHGRTYVVFGAAGIDCEHIHPEVHCHDHAAGAGDRCLADEDCCSDDFEAVLSLYESQDGRMPDLSAPFLSLPGADPDLPVSLLSSGLPVNRWLGPPPDPAGYLFKISVLRA